jgi:hypothetical protein
MPKPWPSLLLILLGMVFLIFHHYWKKKRKNLLKYGEEAEGTIVSFKHGRDEPVIHFVTLSGASITKEYDVGSSWYKIGQKVQVLYDPADPKEFTLRNDNSTFVVKYMILLIGVGFIIFGVSELFNF